MARPPEKKLHKPDRDPDAVLREERIVTRRDDTEIAQIRQQIRSMVKKDLVVVLVYYATGEFMDALIGMTRVPRAGEYISLPAGAGWDDPKEERNFDKVEVVSVTWQVVNTHGWQPVLHVIPLFNTGAPELLSAPQIPESL